jgi:hypothetical protein
MGILDDAIREHLELKRRHGVPEEELERQEEEALGPARRDVAQRHEEAELTPGQTATAEADEPAPSAVEQETELFDMEDAAAPDAPEIAEPAPVEPTPVEPSPVEPPPAEAGAPDEAPVGEPGHEPDPHDALGDTEPHGFDALEDEDEDDDQDEAEPEAEPDDEEPPASDAEDDELDVLEDTPDFLQETPEHDRLWFEQRPPRDFDFD